MFVSLSLFLSLCVCVWEREGGGGRGGGLNVSRPQLESLKSKKTISRYFFRLS